MTTLALEIGSTELAAVRIAEDVAADAVRRIPMPARNVWENCRSLLFEASDGLEVTGLGIASPGPIDMKAGVVAPGGVPEWRAGFGIVDAAKAMFPAATVRLGLDGVCLAMAERNFGAARETLDVLAVALSGHVAAGVVVGGFTVVGRTGNAGHLGHALVPGFDDRCGCGGRGCLEAVAGGTSMLRWARGQGWAGTSLTELLDAARVGAEVPAAAVGRAGTATGRALVSAAALLDFDLAVLGGPVAEAGPALWKPLGEAIATHARFSAVSGLRVVPSPLGGLGLLAGAGVLALALPE
ncbi:ROK family protein [Nocardia asteroides]|uniref:ROK family protein n=1 Tax=Nocardia asteroides TaxID=1824 RepID=UPI001E4DCEDE|nr:ROK family protein [Nocardia asteroides]UGT63370.1 ROK family protein [Nocardia asteroides]